MYRNDKTDQEFTYYRFTLNDKNQCVFIKMRASVRILSLQPERYDGQGLHRPVRPKEREGGEGRGEEAFGLRNEMFVERRGD